MKCLGVRLCCAVRVRPDLGQSRCQAPSYRGFACSRPRDDRVAAQGKGVPLPGLDHVQFDFQQEDRWIETGCVEPRAPVEGHEPPSSWKACCRSSVCLKHTLLFASRVSWFSRVCPGSSCPDPCCWGTAGHPQPALRDTPGLELGGFQQGMVRTASAGLGQGRAWCLCLSLLFVCRLWLRASTATTGSVCPPRGPSSTCYSRGSTSGLPSASVSGRPRHEQASNGPARLPL